MNADTLTSHAIEWFLAHQDAYLRGYRGEWDLRVGATYYRTGDDPIAMLEEAYDDLHAAPLRAKMWEEEHP